MITEYGFSSARAQFTTLIDKVQSKLPLIIRKRKSSEDDTLLISADLFRKSFRDFAKDGFRSATSKERDGSVTLTLAPFDLAVNKKTKEEAVGEMVSDVIAYCEEYMERRDLYLNSANRKKHLPLVIQVLLCRDIEEVKDLLNLA